MMDAYGMPGFGFGGFFMILWWALIIGGIVALVKWLSGLSRGGDGRSGADHALSLLRERYARGDINEEEFLKKQRDLS